MAAAGEESSDSGLQIKAIPGSYGIPFISPIKDRLDFFYNQGRHRFFQSRVRKHNSTVLRVNMPPGPFISSDPRVVALLDAKSFATLFDSSKVDKRDLLIGTFLPPAALFGGYRIFPYMDATEEQHTKIKGLLLWLLASRHDTFIPSFQVVYSKLFDSIEEKLAAGPVVFNDVNEAAALDFVSLALYGVVPSDTMGSDARKKMIKWLLFQLHPLFMLGLPKFLDDILLHTFKFPPFLISSDYKDLRNFYAKAAAPVLDEAERRGLSREEVLHNLMFATMFNASGGFKVFFPWLLQRIVEAGGELHARLADEVRTVVETEGGKVTPAGLEKMELVKSVVWESLRLDPPVEYQYGHARKDMVVESHDAAFRVKKGEMLFGFQTMATRDERVFERGSEFVADRFVGEEGKKLLKYVVWSNGPEMGETTAENKVCAGKHMVVLMGRLLLAEMFLRYDTFAARVEPTGVEPKVSITSLTRRSLTPAATGDS